MSDISDLFNPELEVNISGRSDEFLINLSPRMMDKRPSPQVTSPKPAAPKRKKQRPRDIVKKNKDLSQLYQTLQKTNVCFENVISTVQCYRPELGATLEKVYSTYNKLFEVVLECTISLVSDKETEISSIQKKHMDFIGSEMDAREEIQNKFNKQNELIGVLKTRLKIATTSEESLNYEIKLLRDIVKYDQNSTNALRTNLEKGRHEGDEEGAENNTDLKMITEEVGLKLKLDNLQKGILDIENEHEKNFHTLDEMRKVLKSMAKSSTSSVNWTQTEEGELQWNVNPASVVPVPSNLSSYYCLIRDVEGNSINMTRPRQVDGLKWSLTPIIMRFLANTPSRAALPYPYAYFKKLLMEICLERLSINPEIAGYMQPQLPLDEFLCIFFLKKHQLRRTAELKMKEFLSSLRFYLKWQRAAVFSKVAGIAVDVLENNEYIYTDYHSQMYFIYCLGVLGSDPTSSWESTEGHTWLRAAKEEPLTLQAMPWVGKNDLRRVRKDVAYMTRTVADNSNNDCEAVDVDQLIGYFMKEYITLRQTNIDKFYKSFLKVDQVHEGSYNYDEFKFIIPSTTEEPLPESIITRAFYYSLTAGSNSFQMTAHSFTAACVRFGLDNPCALAQVGWDLIFPFPMIKYMVDNKDEKYSGLIFKKEKVLAERSNYLKVPGKASPVVKPEPPTSNNTISLEKITALLAQHYSVIRELKKFSDQFRVIIQQKEDIASILAAVEKLNVILTSGCEFFTFPIVF